MLQMIWRPPRAFVKINSLRSSPQERPVNMLDQPSQLAIIASGDEYLFIRIMAYWSTVAHALFWMTVFAN